MAKGTRSRSVTKKKAAPQGFVAFDFESATYQIDVSKQKVYRRWVEVDCIRKAVVISAFRASNSATA